MIPDSQFPISDKQADGRNRILDVAESLFQARGYTAVTMRDIAKAVGMRQASLYYHFPSKEELFVSVRERLFERHRVGLQNVLSREEGELRSQLEGVADWFLSQQPINFHSMMQADMPSLSQEARVRLSNAVNQAIFEPVGQVFTTARANRRISAVRPKLLVGFLLSLLESVSVVYSSEPLSYKKEIVNEMIFVLLEGIQRH
ncbi:TetR/AcrR family transcriptional regulator [Scytonema sp. NUACC26]|uniref:TetR/AcrR family transcriptional regulator n=1 Tax=Scytonema sp. NUACC26 TaxID=3140176 RepID=UPI0034DBC3B7